VHRHRRPTAHLEDLGSKNGTSVGGKPLDAIETLRDRDATQFGSVRATFRAWLTDADAETDTA
jgi:pSer/pThr/pTyr-binding forkhead associated (FHA) protein